MKKYNTLKVALIQTDLVWENSIENRRNFESKINSITADIDLVIFPEMFTTGFTMNAKNVAETMNGKTILWMQKIASKKQIAICGSIVITEDNKLYNRFLFVHPSGKIEFYNKRHAFTLAGEHKVFSAGKKKLIIDYNGWKICPLICYDLRFPVWSRNIENYDLLMYVASWPKARINAWDSLLQARAIENMSYTIGVNRVGEDANNYKYTGNSACYDTLGNCLIKSINIEEVLLIEIRKDYQNKIRKSLNFLNDRDKFLIQ